MKLLFSGILFFAVLSTYRAGDGDKIPATTLKTLDGKKINAKDFSNEGKPFIINFWATWCTPCKAELNNIHEVYADWQSETGVKIITISIDDPRSSAKVAPYVKKQGWQYEVYLDENQDFKRNMNVNNPPQTFLVDGTGRIVWSHTGYAEGEELQLIDQVRKLLKGEALTH
jgi:peroxiredoxin